MSKKLEKLKEIKESLSKRCAEIETFMFIENINKKSCNKFK